MKRVSLLVLLLSGVLFAGLCQSAAPEADSSPLDPLLEKVRSAFQKGDAKPLRALCTPKSRVNLALIGTEVPAGYMSPDQMYFLLNRFFAGLKTVSFDYHNGKASGDQAVRIANWKYQEGQQEPRLLKLQFRFTKEGTDWFLTEIRALP